MKKNYALFIALTCLSTSVWSQALTISSNGQTGTSGTGWSTSGTNPVTVSVSATANINVSVLVGYLNQGIDVVVDNSNGASISWTGNLAKTLGSSARLTLKSGGFISTAANLTVSSSSNALDVVLWADANANAASTSADYILLDQGLAVTTNGGMFFAAGGSDNGSNGGIAADGLPDGFAYSGASGRGGLDLGLVNFNSTGTLVSIETSGGNIVLRGNSASNRPGVGTQPNLRLNAGSGQIVMMGQSSSEHGLEFSYGSSPQIAMTSSSTASPAIFVSGTSTSGAGHRGIFFGKQHVGNLLIQSTSSTGGGVHVFGSAAGTSGAGIDWGFNEGQEALHLVQVLSQSGNVLLSAASGSTVGMILNVDLYLGNAKNTTAVQGITPAVTNSAANIEIRAPRTIAFKANSSYPTRFSTSGTASLMSTSASSTTALDFTGYYDIASGMTSFNFGESGAAYNFTLSQNVSSPSPVKIYAKEFYLLADIATTNTSSIDIYVDHKAVYGSPTPGAASGNKKVTLSTQNGNITLHHDYDLSAYCYFWTYEMDIKAGTGHATLKWPADFGAQVSFPKFYGTGRVSVIHCGANSNTFPNINLSYIIQDADNNGFEQLTVGSQGTTRFIEVRDAMVYKGPVTLYATSLDIFNNLTVQTGDFTLYCNPESSLDDPFYLRSTNKTISAAGKITIAPMNSGFLKAWSYPKSGLTLSSNGLVLGKTGMTSNLSVTAAISATGDLELYGAALNLGANISATGNMVLEGTSIAANHNVRANGNLVVSSSSAVLAPGKYIWVDGNLTNNGSLTLSAANASDGAYAQLKFGGTYTGGVGSSITQQQYLESGRHLMGAPFNNTTAALFGGSSAASGGVGNSGTGYPSNNYNFFGWSGTNWQVLANNSAPVTVGKGYIGHVGANGFRTFEGLQSFTGTVPNTSVSLSLLNSDADGGVTVDDENTLGKRGWNLVANPFTCALNPSAVTSANNMKGAIYRWDPKSNGNSGQYHSHSPAGNPTESHIAPLQAFWVQTNNGSASVNLSMATHGTVSQAPVFRKTGEFEADRLRLTVVRSGDASFRDEAYVAMAEGTVDGFDDAWDAHELNSGADAVYLYTYVEGEASMANNAIPYTKESLGDKIMPLAFRAPGTGETYTLALDQSLSESTYDVFVEDHKTGSVHNLTEAPYTFTNDASEDKRFSLRFRSEKTREFNAMGTEENGLNVWTRQGNLVLWMDQLGVGTYTLIGVDGRELLQGSLKLDGTRTQEVALPSNVTPGVYFVRARYTNGKTVFTRVVL